MDKNAIKKYAVWARTELITRVSQRAEKYDITAEADVNASSVNGVLLSDAEIKQRKALIEQVKQKGFDQVMEEVAYTWFNRFIALRFMEVNGYLPSHIRVFTDDNNNFKPQILAEAIHLELDGLDMDKVYEMKNNNENDELYKYLIIIQCNELSKILPGMFQKISDYTELLFPDNILREGSVIEQMVAAIPENDWTDQVQIIGWMYQYYIVEPKDELINARKQYKDKDIPFVTQLFTSDWIVRFIVENSLGRLWADGHKCEGLISKWQYYVDDSTDKKLLPENIMSDITKLTPEDIKCIDPCAGSGHIIAYGFDVMMQIYKDYGYSEREAASLIVQKNIYGLDIDKRASQLAYFTIMMKACQYDRRFLSKGIQPEVYCIPDSNIIDKQLIDYFEAGDSRLSNSFDLLVSQMNNASIYGSVIEIHDVDFELLENRLGEIKKDISLYTDAVIKEIEPFIKAAKLLSRKYDVVFTNPPYMATKYMPDVLKEYVSAKYPDYKADLFSAFIVRSSEMCLSHGYLGFLTPYVWMFIQSYEKLRQYIYEHMTFSSLVQLEYNAFESACVPVAAFTLRNYATDTPFGCIKLSDFRGIDVQAPKTIEAIKNPECGYRYLANQKDFLKIPGAPVAYWIGERLIDAFENGISVDDISDFTGSQNITADNSKYLRMFWEVNYNEIGKGRHWAYYAKGGEYRKWFGNIQLVVDISNEAVQYYKNCKTANYLNDKYWFQEGITYSAITSSGTGFRYYEPVGGFDKGGATICYLGENLKYVLGVLNSNIAEFVLQVMNPTINLQVKDIKAMPIIIDDNYRQDVENIVTENIEISKEDWDSYEVSYGFRKSPLIRGYKTISQSYAEWEKECNNRFARLKENEEKLNQLLIRIYGLGSEVSEKVDDKFVSVNKADKARDIKNFISYAVGCMFGRYSLDETGFIYAGGEWDSSKYKTFIPDRDGIIPICDDEYFEDDIVGRFVKFVEVAFGKESLEENLQFIAEAIGGNGGSREVIRKYFIDDFFNDHCSQYAVTGSGKRPIYWLFDSGKKNGFKCLVYLHRYQPDTIARIRTDYVHEQQARYRTAIEETENRLLSAEGSDKVKLNKKLKLLKEQDVEIHAYEEKIHHLADQMIAIDLDDGVKENYSKFQDVLAKIK